MRRGVRLPGTDAGRSPRLPATRRRRHRRRRADRRRRGRRAPSAPLWRDKPRPAKELVRELYAGLSDTQKKRVVLPYDHGAGKGQRPTRKGMFNAAINNIHLGDAYTKPQQELIERIVKA